MKLEAETRDLEGGQTLTFLQLPQETEGLLLNVPIDNATEDYATLAQTRLHEALKALQDADRQMRDRTDTAKQQLLRCFEIADPMQNEEDCATVQTVITKIWNGLSANLTIKAFICFNPHELASVENRHGKIPGRQINNKLLADTDAIRGKVSTFTAEQKQVLKPHQNSVALMHNGANVVRGAIQIAKPVLASKTGTRTLIHEASHKFAGTVDHFYFAADGSLGQSGLDTKIYLQNADCYAYFIFGLWAGAPAVRARAPATARRPPAARDKSSGCVLQ